jgi:hypothetical protein
MDDTGKNQSGNEKSRRLPGLTVEPVETGE